MDRAKKTGSGFGSEKKTHGSGFAILVLTLVLAGPSFHKVRATLSKLKENIYYIFCMVLKLEETLKYTPTSFYL